MARIPRTKSRPITVDDVKYRWMVKNARWRYGGSSKNWSQGNAEEWDFTHRAALTPADVAVIIRTARTQGWKPEEHRGRPFQTGGPLDLKEYEIPPPWGYEPPPLPPKNWWDFLMEAD